MWHVDLALWAAKWANENVTHGTPLGDAMWHHPGYAMWSSRRLTHGAIQSDDMWQGHAGR
jgi:hypothetical protein